MKNNHGVEIERVDKTGLAAKVGILPGDILISIDGHKIRDAIDLMFFGNEQVSEFVIRRNNQKITMHVENSRDTINQPIGIMLKPFKVKTCKNNCIFCFVSQLPKGLRRSLYIKDEDYRMSFLYGNYITLTNLSNEDKNRIVKQKLSPLYISVHSTDIDTRNRLIGNPKAGDILKEIKFFADNKIRMHSQIVICPGYNDGRNLKKTISELYRFYPYVSSIAVVPVGLTKYRTKSIKPVRKEDAINIINLIEKFQNRFKKKHGEHIVYASDEMYIKAEKPFPNIERYGDLPQIENGVGMVPLFLHQAKRLKISQLFSRTEYTTQRFITFTGASFYPFLLRFSERLKKAGVNIEIVAINNTFFGESITVAGLLTGRDVMKSLTGIIKKNDILLIPDVVMKEGEEVFLDDVSRQDIEDVLGVEAVIIESTPAGIVRGITIKV